MWVHPTITCPFELPLMVRFIVEWEAQDRELVILVKPCHLGLCVNIENGTFLVRPLHEFMIRAGSCQFHGQTNSFLRKIIPRLPQVLYLEFESIYVTRRFPDDNKELSLCSLMT